MIDPKTGEEVVEEPIVIDPNEPKEPITEPGDGTPPITDGDENVTISKEEMEKLQKYKTDFNGLVKKNNLAKLNNKTVAGEEQDAVLQAIGELADKVNKIEGTTKTNNLSNAYEEFVKENSWVNQEGIFDTISGKVDISNLSTKEEIKAAFEREALSTYPEKYKEHLAGKARSEVLADEANKGAGAGGGGNAGNHFAGDTKSAEELKQEAIEKKWMDPKSLPPAFRNNK